MDNMNTKNEVLGEKHKYNELLYFSARIVDMLLDIEISSLPFKTESDIQMLTKISRQWVKKFYELEQYRD